MRVVQEITANTFINVQFGSCGASKKQKIDAFQLNTINGIFSQEIYQNHTIVYIIGLGNTLRKQNKNWKQLQKLLHISDN